MKTKLILLASILLIGCGTRKTSQTKTDVTTKEVVTDNSVIETKTDTNLKVTYETEIDKTSGIIIETETIEPINSDKTSFYIDKNGNKTELGNSKITKTKTTRKTNEKTKANTNIVENKKVAETIKKDTKTKSKAKVKVKQKATESNKGNFWNWILLIVLVAGVIWFIIWIRKIVKDKEKLEL